MLTRGFLKSALPAAIVLVIITPVDEYVARRNLRKIVRLDLRVVEADVDKLGRSASRRAVRGVMPLVLIHAQNVGPSVVVSIRLDKGEIDRPSSSLSLS